MYNPTLLPHQHFYQTRCQFLESQISNCDDIELKKELLQSYNELIKIASEIDKIAFVNNTEYNTVIHTNNTDWNKTVHTNNTQLNMAYDQNYHTTQQAQINANGAFYQQIAQHPNFNPHQFQSNNSAYQPMP